MNIICLGINQNYALECYLPNQNSKTKKTQSNKNSYNRVVLKVYRYIWSCFQRFSSYLYTLHRDSRLHHRTDNGTNLLDWFAWANTLGSKVMIQRIFDISPRNRLRYTSLSNAILRCRWWWGLSGKQFHSVWSKEGNYLLKVLFWNDCISNCRMGMNT